MIKNWERSAQVLLCCAVIGMTACTDKKGESSEDGAIQRNVSSGPVIASVGNMALTETDFENYLKVINRSHAKGEFRDRLKDEWVTKELFSQAAIKSNLDKDPIYQAKLDQYRRELLSNAYVSSQLQQRFPDELLKPQYEARKAEFTVNEIHISHILLEVEVAASEEEWKKVELEAKQIKEKLHGGEPFDGLAVTLSNDPSTAGRGGDFGWMPLGIAQDRFGDVFQNVTSGDLIGPIRTDQGWHIVAVLEEVKDRTQPFEQVKRQLIEQKRVDVVKFLNEELRKKIEVQIK